MTLSKFSWHAGHLDVLFFEGPIEVFSPFYKKQKNIFCILSIFSINLF